jgi:hypothetical protein
MTIDSQISATYLDQRRVSGQKFLTAALIEEAILSDDPLKLYSVFTSDCLTEANKTLLGIVKETVSQFLPAMSYIDLDTGRPLIDLKVVGRIGSENLWKNRHLTLLLEPVGDLLMIGSFGFDDYDLDSDDFESDLEEDE